MEPNMNGCTEIFNTASEMDPPHDSGWVAHDYADMASGDLTQELELEK